MRHASTLAAILLCSLAGTAPAEEWIEFRGPTGQGHTSVRGLPIEWRPGTNISWQVAVPGRGWSSPIVHKGRIYLTTAVPLSDDHEAGPQSLRAICLDAATGKLVWNVEVFQQPAGVQIHGKNSHASATPITDGKRLFVHFGAHGTAALELDDGQIAWTNRELKYDSRHGNGGSPVLVDGALIVSCDGLDMQFVAALDQSSGKIRWNVPRNANPQKGFSFGTPLVIDVDGAKQVISVGSDVTSAYDPRDGHEIWRVRFPDGYSVVPRPVFGDGLLFVCTGYDSPTMLAIRPQGARGDVTETHVAWKIKKGIPNNPSPLFVDGAIYLIADNGVATCIEAQSGKEQWQKRVGGSYSASPLYAEGRIYLQSEGGEGVVFSADRSGYHELGRNSIGEKSLASYAVGDKALFVRSEGHLSRIEAQ